MSLSIVRLGTPRAAGEGLRIGTVRRPPRGVPKAEFAKRDFYDVWLPQLSPEDELMKLGQAAETEAHWKAFARRFTAQLKQPDTAHLLDALAALSHTSDFAVGCYCENEARCHRSILRQHFEARGAAIAR
ncbi:DUF488 domain-containing protein [Aquabacterium humicola]|uniref:DUF488 domain-containing protein n=1 Tax=Aquabacterium humicola TaxID=3237377 RepID=UPI002543E6F6|nr:DUF488 family protein [Rubrivivax pictus]